MASTPGEVPDVSPVTGAAEGDPDPVTVGRVDFDVGEQPGHTQGTGSHVVQPCRRPGARGQDVAVHLTRNGAHVEFRRVGERQREDVLRERVHECPCRTEVGGDVEP